MLGIIKRDIAVPGKQMKDGSQKWYSGDRYNQEKS